MPTGTKSHPLAAIWVVRLSRHRLPAPGSVGPFCTEAAALAWVTTLLEGTDEWTFEIETVVSPSALPTRCGPRARHLHLVS